MSEKEQERWTAARSEMARYIHAVFWQDLGIGGGEAQRSVDWILDYIVRPQFDKAAGRPTPDLWCVVREEENGGETLMARDLPFTEACKQAHTLQSAPEARQHWLRRSAEQSVEPDRCEDAAPG